MTKNKLFLFVKRQLVRIYVVVDEPTFMSTDFSDEKFDKSAKKSTMSEVSMNGIDEHDASSLLRELEESYDSISLTDIEILRVHVYIPLLAKKI